jgi:AbrB family looped-hinge helix DNA binding protein
VAWLAQIKVTIPEAIREELDLHEGDHLVATVEDGRLILIPASVIPDDQAWFWTPEWQAKEAEADQEIAAEGGPVMSADEFITELAQRAGLAYTASRWWFWPVSLVIKFPAAILMLLVAGALAWYRTGRTVRRRLLLAVGIPGLPLAIFTIASPLNIGVRLLLPVVALWAAAAGALVPAIAALRPAARRAAGTGAAALLAAGATVTALSCPGSIAWTAPPFRPGYAAAADSNLDWGQGLYALVSWSQGRHPWVSYFGPRGLTVAALPGARSLLGMPPDRISGWVAVSATALNSADRSQLAWLRGYCPVSVLAGSVLIFRFAQPPATVAGPAPARPARVCAGTWSVRPH